MRALVTGGAGFIGSELVRQLVGAGEAVVNVDKLTYAGSLANLRDLPASGSHCFVQSDIGDAQRMLEVFREHRPRTVYHLAAETHVDRSIDGPQAFVATNVVGTATLLEAARRYVREAGRDAPQFRFVHVSTDEVYGELGSDGRFTEASPYAPNSPYSATKAGADHLARAWQRTYGLPVIVSNCSNNYGPRQFPEKLIPLTILKALAVEALPVYGDGSNVRDWLHVEDHAEGLITLVDRGRPGERYNFGGESERTNLAVVEQICATLDRVRPTARPRRKLISFVTDRPGHDQRYAIDATKAHRELGWKPRRHFEAGLEHTVHWYLDNRSWWEPVQARVYGGERLGLLEPVQ